MPRSVVAVIVTLPVALAACAPRTIHAPTWMMTETDAARLLERALESDNPDTRRTCVERLAASRHAGRDIVVDGCSVIARTDSATTVRCAAIRLVAKSDRDGAAELLLSILNTDGRRTLPAGEQVRLAALHGLIDLAKHDKIPAEQAAAGASAGLRLFREDRSRDVRIAASHLLAEFPRRDVVNALIDGLGHDDFGIAYHAEQSLMKLTGISHDHDQQAWRDWLAATGDPFAARGRLDAEPEPDAKPWWQRAFLGSGSSSE